MTQLKHFGRRLRFLDSDSIKFINTLSVIESDYLMVGQRYYIDFLLKGLKGIGIWDKIDAIYPNVGNKLSSFRWNLKDIRDNNDAYRLQWSNGELIDINRFGIKFLDSYANTFIYPNTTDDNRFLLVQNTEVDSTDRVQASILRTTSVANSWNGVFIRRNSIIGAIGKSRVNYDINNYVGTVLCNRRPGNVMDMYCKGLKISADAIHLDSVVTMYTIGGNNVNSNFFTQARIGLIIIGKQDNSLTDAEANALFNLSELSRKMRVDF